MHSSDPAYARTGAFRDSGIPGIPRAVAPQYKIIPNALARIFRRRSTIIATGLLALTAFAMMPVDNAEAQTTTLMITTGALDSSDGSVGVTEGETAGEKFTVNMTNARNAVVMRLRIEGVGMTLPTMTNHEATFPNGWTLSHDAPTSCNPIQNPSNGCVTGQSTSSGTHAVRISASGVSPRVFEDREYVDVIWNLSRISGRTRLRTFTLKSRAGATGTYFAPQTATGGLRINPTQVNDRKWRFKRIATPVLTTSFARVDGVDDSILRERDPYSNPSGTNNDTEGDTATVIMDLTHFPTPLPSVSGDPIAATINFTISGTADGPGPDNGTNDFRVSPTNTSNPDGLIWSAISNGRGNVQVKRSLIQGTGSSRSSPGDLGVPGAANTLNSSSSAQIRLRFEPHNNRDTSVENIIFTVDSVRVHSTNEDLPDQNIINRAKMQDHNQEMTIQPSGQANVKLAALDSTGVIHTDGEEKRFTVELGGINPDTAGLTGVRVNLSIAGTANKVFTLRPPQGVGTPHIIETGDYSITLPATVGEPVILPVIGNNPARVSFTVPVVRFMENEGTDPDIGEETFTLILTARVDGILENTERTITISLNTTGAKAELVNSGIQIGDDIPETSDTTGTVLAYNTRRRTAVASLSGGGVNLHALGTNADTNSGTFTFRVEHYNHAISDAAHEETSDYMYVRIDMVPTGAPVGLDTPPPTKFVNSGDTRMITSGDYTISIPNNTSGVEIIPLTNEEAAFRLRIPLTRFNASDTANGTIATRGAEEVIMTVRANDVLPTRRQTTTFSINNVIEFDEHLLPESPFLTDTAFRRANGNFGNDEVTFNLLLPEGLQSWIIDGPVEEVTEGAQFQPSSGGTIDRAFHVGTLYMTGGRNAGYVRTTLTGTVPTGELTIGPDVEFNVQLSLLSPADGSRNNRRDAFSSHMLANGNRESNFVNSGSTATETRCFGLSASGNITREFWAARTDGRFPQPDMDVTLAVTNIQPLQVTGGTLSASQLKSQCATLAATGAPSIDARDTAEFTMLDNGDQRDYLDVDFVPRGSGVTMPEMEEGNQFERPLRIEFDPTSSQSENLVFPWVRYKLHARVESGGLTANIAGIDQAGGPPVANDPLADFTLLLTRETAQSRLLASSIIEFTGFGNELVADLCHPMGDPEQYDRDVWILPRAANSIDDGDKIITFSISDLFFPSGMVESNGRTFTPADRQHPCFAGKTIDGNLLGEGNPDKVAGTQTYPFLAGPTLVIRDGPLVPEFTGGDPALEFAGNPSSASADFDTITLNLDYEEHIRDRVVQNPGVALAGVTHFVYVSSTNTTTVKRCLAGGSGTDINDNTEIPIAELGLDCDDPNNNGKGFIVEGMDRSAENSTRSVINFKLRNRKNIGTQPVRTSVDSVPATLKFVDALSFNPGIRKLTVGSQVFESLPTEAPFAITATLQPEVHEPSVRVVPTDHHSTVEIDGMVATVAETPSDANERSAARSVTVTSGTPFDIKVTTERSTPEVPITRTYSVTPIILASTSDDPGIFSITAAVGGVSKPFVIDLDQVASTGTVILPATIREGDSITISVLPEEIGATVGVSTIANPDLYVNAPLVAGKNVIHINGFTTGDHIFKVRVTTDEGTPRVYAITVTVPSTDEEINTLTVDGFPVSLDDGTSTGSVTIRDGTRVAVISARAAHARATITAISGPDGAETVTSFITVPQNDDNPPFTTFTADVSGLTVGTNEFTITVIPEDTIDPQNPTYTDSAARIYTITVIVPPNGASLSSLLVGGRRLTLNADNPFEADVNLGPDPDTTDVKATAINDTNCIIEANVAINPPCTTITINGTQVRSGSNNDISSPANGQIINIVVTNISAANVTSTRTYNIRLIVPTGAESDTSFRRITVANRNVSSDSTTSSSNSVVVAGGLTEGVVVVTPTQSDAIVTAITGCQGSDCSAQGVIALTGGFTGNNDVTKRSTTLSGFLLDRNLISVTIQAPDSTPDIPIIFTHNIRVTVPFSPPHDDSLASINGLTVNGAVVMLDHDNNTGTVDLPTGTKRATVIATPSQNDTDAHGAIVTAITGTASNRTTALGSDQESNTDRGPLIATLTGLTPDNNAPNTIVVMVSSPNGARTRTYEIDVTIPAALSENTLLSTVTLTPSVSDVDLDLAAGTGTAELPVGTTTATLAVTLADIRSTISDISGTNADGDVLTGTGLGSNTVAGNRSGTSSVTIDNLVTGEDNTIMITVTPQAGAMRTYEILVEIDPVPTGVLTASNPLNLGNNSVAKVGNTDAGTFTLALNGIPSTVNNGTDDVILTAVDVFFEFTISSTGDGDFDTIANNSESVETDDFTLSANGGARFYPASAIVGGGSTDGFVLRVPGTRFNVGAGSPTTHSAETITFTVTTKEITTEDLQNLPYSISFANSHVAWRTAAGAITDSNLAGPDIANFSGALNVFNIDSELGEDAALDSLAIAPEPTEENPFVDVDLNPIFNTGVLTYSTAEALPLGTTTVRITASAINLGTTVISGCLGSAPCGDDAIPLTVNGNIVSGLAPGNNTIEIVVTSENRANNQTYTITAVVDGFVSSTRINRASFAVAGNPVPEEATLTDGPDNNNGSGTVEIGNTDRATITVRPQSVGDIVTHLTGCNGAGCDPSDGSELGGGFSANTSASVNSATLTGFTTGANKVIVTVQKSGAPSITRTYTIAVTVRPAPTAAITTIGGASHTFEEGADTLVRVADFAVDVGAFHAGKCLSATINASSASNIRGSGTNGNGGDFVFYIVDQAVLGGGSAPGDAVPQGFSDGSATARTNGMSIILDSNGQGSRSFYIRARSNNNIIDRDKTITFGITDPKVHVTGCSGFLNPGTPNARTADGNGDIPETGTVITSTALAVSGTFMILSHDDESEGRNPTGAADLPTSITSIGTGRAVTLTEGTTGNVSITFDEPIPLGRSVAYTLTPFIDNNIAASNSDYTATNTVDLTLVGVSGSTYTFPVATTPDRIIENNEEATLTIINVIWTGGNFLPTDDIARTATLTITDSAVASDFVVSFVGDVAGSESDSITAMLEGRAATGVTLERSVRVHVSTRDGTATATEPADYAAHLNVDVDFTAGGVAGRESVIITPTIDTVVETNETLELTVRPDDTAVTANDTATVTIEDVPPGLTVTLPAAAAITEGAADRITITLTATADPPQNITLERAVKVRVSTRDGTATASNDFTAVDRVVEIGPNLTAGTTFTATTDILILNDAVAEAATETFTLNLAQTSPTADRAVALGASTTEITINNDDTSGVTITPTNGAEGGRDGSFLIVLSNPPAGETATVTYALSSPDNNGSARDINYTMTAEAGSNITNLSDGATGTFVIAASSTGTGTLTVAAKDDNDIYDEKITLTISEVRFSGGHTLTSSMTSAPLTLTDNNALTVEFSSASPMIVENNAATVMLTVGGGTVINNRGVPTVTVRPVTGGTATAVADYATGVISVQINKAARDAGSAAVTIPVVLDMAVETDETIALDLTATSVQDGAHVSATGRTSTTAIIMDDPPNLRVDLPATATIAEDAGSLSITLTATADPAQNITLERDVTVRVSTRDGTAMVGNTADFTAPSEVVSFRAGGPTVFTMTTSIPIIDDMVAETATETFTLNLAQDSPPDRAVTLGATTATRVTITDDDRDRAFTVSAGNVAEDVITNTVTVNLGVALPLGSVPGNVSFDYAITTGDSSEVDRVESEDVGALTGTGINPATILSGRMGFTFPVTIMSDNAIENNESAQVTVSNITAAGGVSISGSANTTFTITDVVADDDFTVSFTTGTSMGDEGNPGDTNSIPNMLLGVAKSGVTLERDVLVLVTSADGTAVARADYTALADTTGMGIVTFPESAYSTTDLTDTQDIEIIPIRDTVVEPKRETLELTVQQAATDTAATIDMDNNTVTVTIVDDDTITRVRFAPMSGELAEVGEGSSDTNPVTVTYTGTIADGHSVDVTFIDSLNRGTAEPLTGGTVDAPVPSDADYAIPSFVVTLTGGSPTANLGVTIIDHPDDIETDETIVLTLTNGGEDAALYTLGDPATATRTLTIIDDSTISVRFVMTESSQPEPNDDTTHNIAVRYTGSIAVGHSVDVTFDVSDVTATSADYTATSTTVTLPAARPDAPPESKQANISITILPDDIVEPDETFVLTLTNSGEDAGLYELTSTVSNTMHEFTITDPDTISVEFEMTAGSVTEATGGATGDITVTATGGIATGLMIDVPFSVGFGSPAPTLDADYDKITPLRVRFGPSLSETISVRINNDNIAEPNEDIVLTLTTPAQGADYTLGTNTGHTLTIIDDDAISVQFATPDSNVNEGAAATTTPGDITVSYTGTTNVDVDVTFEVSSGTTATSGTDYNVISSLTVTLPASGSSEDIPVTIRGDDMVEPNEDIVLTLLDDNEPLYNINPTGNAQHTLTINNDDTISVAFVGSASEVTESRTENITVRATGATTTTTIAEGYSVDVPFTFVSTATEGTDYNPPVPNSPITFGFNDLVKTISVTTLEDTSEDEDDETITFTLTGPGAGYTLGTPMEHRLTIVDASDDNSLASLTVDGVDVPLSHDNDRGTATLPHAGIMHVPIVATPNDEGARIISIDGQDFSANPGQSATLMNVFVSNSRAFEVVVQAENEDLRTYTITVVIPTTPQDTSQLRPMASVSPTTPTIPETDGNVTIFVRLNRPVSETVELPFTITITATDPADANANDYGIGFPPNCDACDEATGGTLVFAPNQQQREITFSATPDTDAEGDQVILFKLNSGTQGVNQGAVIVPNTAQATITIRDDDIPPTSVSVSASRTRVREDAGTATITVTLNSTAVTGPNIIIPFTFPDSAGAMFGIDYTVTSDECNVNCDADGSLTFATGDRVKTLTVTGIDDTPEDPEEDTEEDETIIFKLTPGDYETVTVASADEVTLTLATNVTDTMETMRDVEVVTSLTGIKQVGMITGLIRQRFSDTVPTPSFGDIGSGTSGSGSSLNANALADDPDFGAPSFSLDLPDNPENLGDLLNGFGFNTYARADAGGVWSMWVRGQYTNLDGSTTQESPTEDINPTLSYDGSATGVGLGMEWAGENTIIGIAADYITTVLDISTTSENITLSKYKETILLAAPYFALRRDKSHSFWMSLGVGTGTANATLDGTTRSADVKAGFANAGVDITVAEDAHEFVVGLSGSAIRKETDPFTFDDAVIPKVTTDSFQARGDITYAHTIGVGGGSMRPYIGLSTIHDFGDTPSDDEHALGLRSGITFRGLNLDLNLEGSSEILRDDHKQWTISGNARFHSNPDNSGLSLSLDGSRGGDVGAGIEGSYGLPIRRFHPDAMLTPFAALRREDDSNEVVSGMRFSIGDDLDIDLQNTRRPHDDNETAVNLRFHREF